VALCVPDGVPDAGASSLGKPPSLHGRARNGRPSGATPNANKVSETACRPAAQSTARPAQVLSSQHAPRPGRVGQRHREPGAPPPPGSSKLTKSPPEERAPSPPEMMAEEVAEEGAGGAGARGAVGGAGSVRHLLLFSLARVWRALVAQ
jgi:hypothetical protein